MRYLNIHIHELQVVDISAGIAEEAGIYRDILFLWLFCQIQICDGISTAVKFSCEEYAFVGIYTDRRPVVVSQIDIRDQAIAALRIECMLCNDLYRLFILILVVSLFGWRAVACAARLIGTSIFGCRITVTGSLRIVRIRLTSDDSLIGSSFIDELLHEGKLLRIFYKERIFLRTVAACKFRRHRAVPRDGVRIIAPRLFVTTT